MSKSLKRVRSVLEASGVETEIRQTGEARTAQMAANELSVQVDQIVKSIVFRSETTGDALLFLTAGGQQVDLQLASELAGDTLGKADADLVRKQTGFAIGGVSPVGHLSPIRCWMDRTLLQFGVVWAAAGTPHHVFRCDPKLMPDLASATVSDFVVRK